MSLADAIVAAGPIPPDTAPRATKKRYSELLSKHLAYELAAELREVGFDPVYPQPGGAGERTFQGGLGPKRVDVTHSDEQHGLLLAISVKSINFAPFGKNLKNRFADLCTEAVTLHMRFPYAVVCAFFAFPVTSSQDGSEGRRISTFVRATRLLATISGRSQHTDPAEKYENITMMLYEPMMCPTASPWLKLVDAETEEEVTVSDYFARLRKIYDQRNPHTRIADVD
ncbi:MAG: hypothetical protein JXQ73_34025 [Phycisphaerae bacterium]|nr:hypothetical protein [Phycisphaerae bacterium]